MARQLARRRHRERLVGVLVVCLGFAVLAVAIVALREPKGHVAAVQSRQTGASNVAKNSPTSASKSTKAQSPARSTHPARPVTDVPLVVLNNTTVHGLAEQAAQRFESGGWTVTSFGNYQNYILSTCAYYDPSYPGARAAAKALQRQYPTIKRVEPKFAPSSDAQPLPDGPVVVVLTPDYSAA
jgi:hypothetical protein